MIGPKDARNRRSRCQACTRRKIKCEGGVPCVYCTKSSHECVQPAMKDNSNVIFVVSTPGRPTKKHKPRPRRSPAEHLERHLTSNIPIDDNGVFLKHFFASFIERNSFTGTSKPDLDGLIVGFQSSPGLCDAIIAVAALDLGRSYTSRVYLTKRNAESRALAAYSAAVTSTQAEIERNTIVTNEHTLWTTFFLGLFELMYDVSGEGWVKHFLYGTSKLLQLRGPDAHRTGRGRSFFITMRVLEICRALIYNESTFLWHDEWKRLTEKLWEGEFRFDWHPKEALLDLMVDCASLSYRTWEIVTAKPTTFSAELNLTLLGLVQEGACLRTALEAWLLMFIEFTSVNNGSEDFRAQDVLSLAYYHASSIFLSGIFDYRPQFMLYEVPSLNEGEIQAHVAGILTNTKLALNKTNVAGILLFFPLRVAGARTKCDLQKHDILEMFGEISKGSFVVADAFREDLTDLWAKMDRSRPY